MCNANYGYDLFYIYLLQRKILSKNTCRKALLSCVMFIHKHKPIHYKRRACSQNSGGKWSTTTERTRRTHSRRQWSCKQFPAVTWDNSQSTKLQCQHKDLSDMRTGCQHLLQHTPTDKPFLRLTQVRLISTLFQSKEQARFKLELLSIFV